MELTPDPLVIRPIEPADAATAAQLCGELGYPAEQTVLLERIGCLRESEHRAVLVAETQGAIVGWIDLSISSHLQGDPFVEIGGLVVAAAVRSQGIGRQLVAAAERWATEKGIDRVVVRSRTTRRRAHQFYIREGYVCVKTSMVFEKLLEKP